MLTPMLSRRGFTFAAAAAASAARCINGKEAPLTVRAKKSVKDPEWTVFPTRTLDQLIGFRASKRPIPASRFGGRKDRRLKGTGFFRVAQEKGRSWLVDPEGYLSIHPAITSVRIGGSARAQAAAKEKFGTPERWAEATVRLLRDMGVAAIGAWSVNDILGAVTAPLPYHTTFGFVSAFAKAKKLSIRQPGHTGYVRDCMPLFHPEFEPFCLEYGQQLEKTKSDPLLVGHFSDNETPAPLKSLDNYLSLDPADSNLASGRAAAEEWLAKRKGAKVTISDVNDADRDAFLEFIYERYLQVVGGVIRKYDPNHIYLGPRLWGPSMKSPGILRACGRHLEAIAINIYHHWAPDPAMLAMWQKESGKPFMVTEFYAKGMDSGLPNNTGAGWTVPTQEDRARFYQHFTLALIECRNCVGWQWLTYQDNDPEDKAAELSNLDANKGIVDIKFEPYQPLVNGMKAINSRMYELADYFDSVKS
jgi:hypothetical protein